MLDPDPDPYQMNTACCPRPSHIILTLIIPPSYDHYIPLRARAPYTVKPPARHILWSSPLPTVSEQILPQAVMLKICFVCRAEEQGAGRARKGIVRDRPGATVPKLPTRRASMQMQGKSYVLRIQDVHPRS
jgi:hypothetical protein